jgi:peptide/nickel transport system substrate-binding protein
MNADTMNVAGEPGSEASKNLRKAFATILSVYRDTAIDSYYGDAAAVINYPISTTSWAAPQATDEGYRVAFSTDVEGNDIYTSDMDDAAREEACLKAALGFFEAAGYTVADGKLTAAPDGAKMSYEVWIPADGAGDHPSFMMLNLAKDALAKIGMELVVKDLANSADLWTGIEADQVDMWCAAWGATPDPDMYQVYYSGSQGGEAGGSNYMYDIADPELDKLILEARENMDQSFRKQMYKSCLDIIVDWAVEVPVYQRQNAIIFSTERVNLDTVTPDITTYYGWMAEIRNLELK